MRTYTFISIAGVFHVSFFSSQEVIVSTWRSGENSLPFQSKPLPRAAHPPSSCRLWGWTSKQTLNPHTTPFFIWFQGKSKKCDQRMALMKRTLFPLCSKSLAAWLCLCHVCPLLSLKHCPPSTGAVLQGALRKEAFHFKGDSQQKFPNKVESDPS